MAWLLTSLITSWTTYPTLTVASWSTVTYGPRSAQIYFLVTNTGTGPATGCQAHLRLGDGQLVTTPMATISVSGTQRNYLNYTETGGARQQASYLWAVCSGGQSPRKPVATVGSIALVTARPLVSRLRARTTVTFRLRNLGAGPALRCQAFARLDGLIAAGRDLGPDALTGHSAATLAVTFRAAEYSRPGHPIVAWAQCRDPAAAGGFVTSSRSYLAAPRPGRTG